MARKKTNPGRIPVRISEAEARRIIDEEADRMLLCSWAVVLCAMASRRDTTAEGMLDFCEAVNVKSSRLRTCEEVTACLERLEGLTEKPFPFYTLSIDHIRSRGDVERLRRRTAVSAMHSMFALIADAVVTHTLMDDDDLRFLFQKAHDIAESFHAGEITTEDLLWVLEEEYGLFLTTQGANVILERIDPQAGAVV